MPTNKYAPIEIDEPKSVEKDAPISQALVHGLLMLGQVINGAASVIGKLGMVEANPVLFAFAREASACPFFFAICYFSEVRAGSVPPITRRHMVWFVAAGACLWLNQTFYVTGVKLANSVIGAAWQPSQPIFVIMICIFLGWESLTCFKAAGVMFALIGGAVMILGDDTPAEGGSQVLLGNVLFFWNCLGTALYVICTLYCGDGYLPGRNVWHGSISRHSI